MRIYFFRSSTKKSNKSLDQAEEILRRCGVEVITNRESNEDQFRSEEIIEARRGGKGLVSTMSGFIMELSEPHQEVGYFLALALLYKKPVLCMYPQGGDVRWFQGYVKQVTNNKSIEFKSYSRANVRKIILGFHEKIQSGLLNKDDIPSMKFTLRISPRIERYLSWKSGKIDMSKADYLRGLIKKLMDDDEEYGKFLDSKEEKP